MSWEQLQNIHRENKAGAIAYKAEPPSSCPIDGELLDVATNGIRNCPLGNYRWEGQEREM